ncbi:sigma-70 family RNA polymerase sigma factor [Microlunatus endophyticus]
MPETVPSWVGRGKTRMENDRLSELIRRAGCGQEDAFAELYDLTAARVHGIVLRVLQAPDLAAEVTQEVYVEIWQQSSRYNKSSGSVMAWALTIARRRAIDRVRATAAQTARDDLYARQEPRAGDHRGDEVWEATREHFDADRIQTSLEKLTESQQQALTLAYFGGYTQSQIARLLQIPIGTVKTRIRDGLSRLRDELRTERGHHSDRPAPRHRPRSRQPQSRRGTG